MRKVIFAVPVKFGAGMNDTFPSITRHVPTPASVNDVVHFAPSQMRSDDGLIVSPELGRASDTGSSTTGFVGLTIVTSVLGLAFGPFVLGAGRGAGRRGGVVGVVGVGMVDGVVGGVVDGDVSGVVDCDGVELLLLGAGFTVIVMTALVAAPFQSRIRYGTLDVPVKPAWGVNVTTPVAVSTLKVPCPAMVTVV
jgi:hypothetical protein